MSTDQGPERKSLPRRLEEQKKRRRIGLEVPSWGGRDEARYPREGKTGKLPFQKISVNRGEIKKGGKEITIVDSYRYEQPTETVTPVEVDRRLF